MDEIFGPARFVNEIVWCYKSGGSTKKHFARKHDTIFYYSKSDSPTFNVLKEKSYNRDFKPYRFEGVEEFEDEIGWYTMVNMRDYWEIDMVGRTSSERLNYPTQKPEALLERIILASTKPGDIVFDAFMGSGTTQAVAMKLGRKFLGADINLGAIQITTKRLMNIQNALKSTRKSELPLDTTGNELIKDLYYGFEVFNVNNYDIFRNPEEAKLLLLESLEVTPFRQGSVYDGEREMRMVKIMPVNRIATKADLNELITGFDYKAFEKRHASDPNKPVEKITLVCMGHEPDLAATLKKEVHPYNIDVDVIDILRDKNDLQFKRDSEAELFIDDKHLKIDNFYPMNLLQKLSFQKEKIGDWRELVESVMIDWNYDGAVLQPSVVDIPEKDELVKGKYKIPEDAGTIRIKITDLLSESLEMDLQYG